MFHVVNHGDIQSVFCDFTHATTASFGICSRFLQHMQRTALRFPINYSLIHKTRNVSDDFKSKCASDKGRLLPVQVITNLLLYDGSLGYWTVRYIRLTILYASPLWTSWWTNNRVVGNFGHDNVHASSMLFPRTMNWCLVIRMCHLRYQRSFDAITFWTTH